MKQYSIRDVMLLIALVALALGWWIDRSNPTAVPGRYRLHAVGNHNIIIDTATGKLWDKSTPGYMD